VKYTPKLPQTNVNVSRTSPLKEFLVLASAALVIVVGIYILMGFAVDWIIPHISIDLEKKMAHPFLNAIEDKAGSPEMEDRLQQMIRALQEKCVDLPYTFRVHVHESEMINAAAFPGGNLVVFTGLLDKVATENELQFILAHEMGHYANRDHLRGLGRAVVLIAVSTVLFGADSGAGNMLGSALNLTELRFSRKQETKADEYALDVLHCRFGHVAGCVDFFEKMPEEQDPGRYGHYFSTHPENRKRIDHIQNVAREKGYGFGDKKPLNHSSLFKFKER
jgi:Zn-dependent protease with chaperone function